MTDDLLFLQSENDKKPVTQPPALISEWVDGRRVLPTNTPFPGLWENSRSPYGIEVADNMSPFSPVITTSVMKGAQIGLTAWAENVMGYWMAALPAEILYVSATDGLLEKWTSKRLDPLIDSIGMRDKIFAQIDNAKSRRTGDKLYSKSYVGGTLDMASAQSASGLRSDSKRVLILDEVDGAPRMLRTGEGNWLDVAYARTNAWGARKKILEFSTPTTFEDSLIRERYEAGDRRQFRVPCPFCGVMMELEFQHLKHEMKHGQLEKVWYECPHCIGVGGKSVGKLSNHHKTIMLSAGQWEPTAVASSKNHRSYQISSLYSPVGMLSWFEMFQQYLDAKDKPGGLRSFTNLYLGMPYKEQGSRPKVENVIELRGEYREGEVPRGVLFLTMFVDVQRGSANDPANPPRLELEVLGHGAGFRTWSILYKVIEGETTSSAFEGAWEKMHDWAVGGGLSFKRADGLQFPVSLVFIDSGDGPYIDIVYQFASRWDSTFPSKGFSALKKQKHEKGDEAGPHNFKKYRRVQSTRFGETEIYEISTNFYKNHVYNNLKITRRDIEPQKPGFCNFPRDRGEKYFAGLTAEEKRSDGSFHNGGRRNEPLDCRAGALCAGDVYLDAKVSAIRATAKANGASEMDIQKINHAYVLDLLEKQTAWRM
jgi:phage terminase large subunit GpA-like protein